VAKEEPSAYWLGAITGPFVIGGFAALIAGAFLLRGYVGAILWNWFIAPTFGVIELTTLQAIGVVMAVNAFSTRSYSSHKDRTGLEAAFALFLPELFLWLFGWILHQFI
jgi:hypothetical protein